jgi:hypothetical protein
MDLELAEALARDAPRSASVKGVRSKPRPKLGDAVYRAALDRDGRRFQDAPVHERTADDRPPPRRQGAALVPSRLRSSDLRSLSPMETRQAKVLFAQLSECTSARGTRYLKGWAGASNLIAFPGDDDEQGRPTWRLYLSERTRPEPKTGTAPVERRERQEQASSAPALGGVDADFEDAPY